MSVTKRPTTDSDMVIDGLIAEVARHSASARAWQEKAAYENGRATMATEKALEAEEALRYGRDAIDSAVASENAAVARVAQLEAELEHAKNDAEVSRLLHHAASKPFGDALRTAMDAMEAEGWLSPEQVTKEIEVATARAREWAAQEWGIEALKARVAQLEAALNVLLEEHTDCPSCDLCDPAHAALSSAPPPAFARNPWADTYMTSRQEASDAAGAAIASVQPGPLLSAAPPPAPESAKSVSKRLGLKELTDRQQCDILEEAFAAPDADPRDERIRRLRGLLFLHHGCTGPALYGDDGEMQCNRCVIDFRRYEPVEIEERFSRIELNRLAALAAPEGKP